MMLIKEIILYLIVVLCFLCLIGCARQTSTNLTHNSQETTTKENEKMVNVEKTTNYSETTKQITEEQTQNSEKTTLVNDAESATLTSKLEHETITTENEKMINVEKTTNYSETTKQNSGELNTEKTAKLFVKGKAINGGNYVKVYNEERYAEIPLIITLEAIGANVEWHSATTATITLYGKEYNLDSKECVLTPNGGSFSVLSPAPGGVRRYRALEHELIIDNDTIKGFLMTIGMNIRVDYEEMIVNIE